MPDKITVKVDLHGTEEALLAAGPKIARRLLRKVLNFIGLYWVAEVKAHVPVDTGDLRDSIIHKVEMKNNGTGATVTVGPGYDRTALKNASGSQGSTSSPGVYGLFVEFGVHAHKYTNHPFMRPTFDATADTVTEYFAAGLREDLEDALK